MPSTVGTSLRSKIKCSGGISCDACQLSNSRCIYSPLNRLGRPKGSKNRRNLSLQQNRYDKSSKSRRSEVQQHVNIGEQGSRPGQDPESDETDMQEYMGHRVAESNFDCEFDATFLDESRAGPEKNYNLHFSPTVSRLDGSMNATHMSRSAGGVSAFGDLSGLLAQTNSTFAQTPFPDLQFDSVDAFNYNSGYTVSTESSPWTSSPCSSFNANYSFHARQGTGCFTDATAETYVVHSSGAAASPQANSCFCLQQHVQLVYQLSRLEENCSGINEASNVEQVLGAMQSARGPWKALMKCNSCQTHDNQREVFLLFAMSIRVLFTSVKKVAIQASNDPNIASTTSFNPLFRARGSSNESALPVRVGHFELTGSAKDNVIRLALRQALQNIQSALLHLRERTGNSRAYRLVEKQATGHQAKDTNKYILSSPRNAINEQIEPETSTQPPTVEPSQRSPSVLRKHNSSPHLPQMDPLNMTDFDRALGDDDFGGLLKMLQCSMSAVE
ncbi:hypothetical protein BU23DRAFT_629555 [Bimuria novae-zelandiae CBS 107.79]|uniref:Zn(2)-C6 fungal-type domain-containing protein n=1 Tax=Bimuria novae-zelandiae CBS 107.79 TaxID=1447943 RepID=A0A6A5UJF8_9PLEO|nr:hypothetical protein BU23DRAFT_629555 [Bimuria novae-zelandiae CBS 107.79]